MFSWATTRLPKADRRVALYGSASGNRGGTGVYTERLLRGFALAGITGVIPVGKAASGTMARMIEEHLAIPASVRRGNYDLLHLPAFGGRPVGGVPYAVTVHDLAFMRDPGWFPPLRSLYYRLHFPRVARGASLILADSDFTAGEIGELLGLPSRRVYLSAPDTPGDPFLFRERFGLRGRFILFTGTVEPRKNLQGLLNGWPAIRRVHPDMELVVTGRWGWGPGKTRELLRETPGVRWTGSIPEEMLRSAMAAAELLVYPSLYEGFGLPPLEAAVSGTPSVLGPARVLREVYGQVAAGFCGASPESIASAVLESLDTGHDRGALMDFAGRFSMERMARETWSRYLEVME